MPKKKASNKSVPRVVVSCDSGNGATKSVVWNTKNKTTSKDIFPSVRAELLGTTLGSGDEMSFDRYRWYDKLYCAGEEVLHARSNIDRHLGADRYGGEFHQFLTAVAIARQGIGIKSTEGARVILNLFAPPGMFLKAKSVILEQMTGRDVEITYNGVVHRWTYESVTVMPEGLAAVGAGIYDQRGRIKDEDAFSGATLLIDGGANTLDFILMEDGLFNPESMPSATHDTLGIQNTILVPILTQLRGREEFRNLALERLDAVLRAGLRNGNQFELNYGGHTVDLTWLFEERFRQLAEQAMNVIDSQFAGMRGIERAYLIGGWEAMVFTYLTGTYEGKVTAFPVDGVYANCIGAMNTYRHMLENGYI